MNYLKFHPDLSRNGDLQTKSGDRGGDQEGTRRPELWIEDRMWIQDSAGRWALWNPDALSLKSI